MPPEDKRRAPRRTHVREIMTHPFYYDLLRAHPINWEKRDAPKVGCRLPELDSHFCRTSHILPGEDDAAFLFFPTYRVLQNESLIRHYSPSETDQRAMGANRQRVRPFKKGASRLWKSISDYWNVQDEPLATPFLGPVVWRSQLLLIHK